MEQRLTSYWYREPAGPSLLQPFAWLYGWAVRARRGAYARGWLRSFEVGRPVVIVGNLTVGGTGKTPLTIHLAQQLTALGVKVGILSRGFGGSASRARARGESGAAHAVRAGSPWQQVGDEPLVLLHRTGCPVVVARDRVAGARVLVAQGVNVILADDGLQHLRLKRDCEIIVIDGARGFGNGRVLPAGPLREPLALLGQADVVVVNGAPEHPSLRGALPAERTLSMTLEPAEALAVDGRTACRLLESFRGSPLHAVAGIGNPARFFGLLRARGLTVIEHAFPDHHPFTAADLSFADELPVLMTEKDAVKCRAFASARLWYLPVAAAFSDAGSRELLLVLSRKLGLCIA
jgi:tetraacyldisaccharide 4'-kinase